MSYHVVRSSTDDQTLSMFFLCWLHSQNITSTAGSTPPRHPPCPHFSAGLGRIVRISASGRQGESWRWAASFSSGVSAMTSRAIAPATGGTSGEAEKKSSWDPGWSDWCRVLLFNQASRRRGVSGHPRRRPAKTLGNDGLGSSE